MAGCGCDGPGRPAEGRFRRVLWIALVLNATMFVVEVIASVLSGSMALQADALDFLGDSANYVISLCVLGMGLAARARAAMLKGLAMGAFGVWVLGSTLVRVFAGGVPDPHVMGITGSLALAANVTVALLLFRFRTGDANMRSVWLCSRNDVLANLAVLAAALGVYGTASAWPDLAVAGVIAALSLHAAVDVVGRARGELREARAGDGRLAPAPAGTGD